MTAHPVQTRCICSLHKLDTDTASFRNVQLVASDRPRFVVQLNAIQRVPSTTIQLKELCSSTGEVQPDRARLAEIDHRLATDDAVCEIHGEIKNEMLHHRITRDETRIRIHDIRKPKVRIVDRIRVHGPSSVGREAEKCISAKIPPLTQPVQSNFPSPPFL